MKINHISAKHFIAVRNIDVALESPVSLFAGKNEAGKSSLREAVTAVLTGDVSRVTHKKDYAALVTDGKKRSEIVLSTDHGDAQMTFPDGKHIGLPIHMEAIPYVVSPEYFASQKEADRRTFLFHLTGLAASGATVREQLISRKCDEKKIETVLPMLRSGFPAACDFAKDKARTAKSDWKSITGEQWGSDKAEGWEAGVPDFDAKRLGTITAELPAIEARSQAASKDLGALGEKQRAYRAHVAMVEKNKEVVKSLSRLEAKLKVDEAALVEAEAKLADAMQRAGAAPREGLIHELGAAVNDFLGLALGSEGVSGFHKNGDVAAWDSFEFIAPAVAAREAYITQYGEPGAEGDTAARESLPKLTEARELLKRCVANDKRDIDAAKAAAAALELSPDVEDVADSQLDALRTTIEAAKRQHTALVDERAGIDRAKDAATAAKSKTEKASQHHADIGAWLAIAEALEPDGIPGEMLANALKPINDLLKDYADITGWKLPVIGADMTIRAGDRLYGLLSESAQWRVDAMIATAIAELSELKLVLLDRADVLDLPARGELLAWLDTLAYDGAIDTAMVFATLKQLPTGLADTTAAFWIDNGVIEASSSVAVAA